MADLLPPSPAFPFGVRTLNLSIGSELIRVHQTQRSAIFFGPKGAPQNRFDAPNGEYKIMYAAEKLQGAFVETIIRRPSGRIVRRGYIEDRSSTILVVKRELTLAMVMNEGLGFLGVTAIVTASEDDDYPTARQLALGLHETYPHLDGLAYRSRHNNGEICYGLFDRVSPLDFDVGLSESFASQRGLVDMLCARHGVKIDTSGDIPEILPS